jgi:superoxide dismutase, Cu-Zn family
MNQLTAFAASALLLAGVSAFAKEPPLQSSSPPITAASDAARNTEPIPGRLAQRKDATTPAAKEATPKQPPAPTPAARADIKAADGKDVGTADFTQTRNGVRIVLALKGLPPGERAMHLHAVGKCEPPFTSAGPHFNPEQKKHGKLNKEGYHAGDMDNIKVPANGNLKLTVTNKAITLEKGKPNSLYQDGGTAIIIHGDKDDYTTDPTGNAGDRIACGVITEAPPKTR